LFGGKREIKPDVKAPAPESKFTSSKSDGPPKLGFKKAGKKEDEKKKDDDGFTTVKKWVKIIWIYLVEFL